MKLQQRWSEMRFRKISFNNYRCFLNGEIRFNETKEKNINLIIGTNGAGKTELLFAFWWALYGFNFKSLKNKEATPYALNSTLYKLLQSGLSDTESCSVTVEIEFNNVIYIIKRTAEFRKTGSKISSNEYQTLRYFKSNHELSLPIRDESEINKQLTRIVPKTILNGIVFDGERMKQLSSVDESSVKAIAGVINDITNVELIEQCKLTFSQIQRTLSKRARSLAKQNGDVTLSSIISEIDVLQSNISKFHSERTRILDRLTYLQMQSQELSLKLDEIKEVKLLERQRKEAEEELKHEENNKAVCISSFMESICNSYLICCGPIFAEVEKLIKKYDVPADLTVPAVRNILNRSECICGTKWTPEMRNTLESLINILPPDNINSAIGETIRQLKLRSKDKSTVLRKDYQNLKEHNENIKVLKDRIASLSTQITGSGSEAAGEIEKLNQKVQQEIINLTANLKIIGEKLPRMEKEIESKKKIRTALSRSKDEADIIERKENFVEKCLLALSEINKVNRMTALQEINQRIQEAYKELSDDYDLGRRIYIVQYDDTARFQIVTYFEDMYQKELLKMKEQGNIKSMKAAGFTDEFIQETAIINCAQSNSTGQSKMNTLAFVKAILDYANEPNRDQLFEVAKEYPLLIDAPFGDIFDKNLERSAKNLHTFTNQIILMLAKESYTSVSQYIGPYVSSVHQFEKVENEDHSSINSITLGEI